jgi:hypothetical protein
MKKVSFLIGCSIIAAGMLATSCSKNSTPATTSTATVSAAQATDAQDNSIASATIDNVDAQILGSGTGSLKADAIDSTEPEAQTKVTHYEKGKKDIELSFDSVKNTNKEFAGKFILETTFTGDSTKEINIKRKVTFAGFRDNGRQLQGTKTISYLGKNASGQPRWEITDSGKIILKNGKIITFNYDRIRTQIAGDSTATTSDDVFQISGTGSGVNRNGIAYTTTSTNLVKVHGCPFYKSGTVTYVSTAKTVTITYNGGTACDPSATVAVDGKTVTIQTDTESK